MKSRKETGYAYAAESADSAEALLQQAVSSWWCKQAANVLT
jgi:hypothetical protein